MGKNSITIHSDMETGEIVASVPESLSREPASGNLYSSIRDILLSARARAYEAVNSEMLLAYWAIGQVIVEDEQRGSARGDYGKGVLKGVSSRLSAEFGTGFSVRNLQLMKQFYLTYQNAHALRTHLSWTHYRTLLQVKDDSARQWYEREAESEHWSSRQLARQIQSSYYERLLLSEEKEGVVAEAEKKVSEVEPVDFIKDPYVLEFTGLSDKAPLRETDLEQALIDNLEDFLLEMGRGFAFVSRQKHLDLDGDHFFVDLVFYNFILKCFVLVDLKTGELTHQDVGQMDTYVRIYDDLMRKEGDNPTIGILLCSQKNEAIARYSLLNDGKQLFASKYQFTLPTEEELQDYVRAQRLSIEAESEV